MKLSTVLSFNFAKKAFLYGLIAFEMKIKRKTRPKELFNAELEGNDPIVYRQENGDYCIDLTQWQLTNPYNLVSISTGQDSRKCTQIAVNRSAETILTIPDLVDNQRHYFKITTDTGQNLVVAERLLPFYCSTNFRDLGGYKTQDGRRIAWGKLYRSGHLADLNKADLTYLESLGLKLVIDFRGPFEIKKYADKLPSKNRPTQLTLSIESEGLEMNKLRNQIIEDDLGEYDFEKMLMDATRWFARAGKSIYGQVVEKLQADEVPMLFHCTAGKDRTGFAAVLIFLILGVPKETIKKDYLASNFFRAEENKTIYDRIRLFTNPEVLVPLIEVNERYFDAAFDVIEQYSSIEKYLERVYGLTEGDITDLRNKYLV